MRKTKPFSTMLNIDSILLSFTKNTANLKTGQTGAYLAATIVLQALVTEARI